MSAPMSACISAELSGVSLWKEPSYTERNVAPSSSIFGSSENIWYPPESVSVKPVQFANDAMPPAFFTISAPGLSIK